MSIRRNGRLLGILLAVCIVLSTASPLFAQSGTDLKGHWAEAAMNLWVGRDIVKGYPDGTVKPDGYITRAEYAALINRTFGLAKASSSAFSDVKGDDWFAADIAKAVAAGYMEGYPDGTVKPNGNITRQEAALILARLTGLERTGERYDFTDYASIPEWSRWAVVAVAKAGLMTGYPDGSFGPTAKITRAETVTALDRLVAEIYTEEGSYGTSDKETIIDGNAVITSTGVNLTNARVKGDLLIAESVGEGSVTLDSVTVDGVLKVSGGGSKSVAARNCSFRKVLLLKRDVRFAAQGSTSIDELIVPEGSGGAGIELDGDASVGTLSLNGSANVSGTGTINNAAINAAGVVIEQRPNEVTLGEGITANIAGRDVSSDAPSMPPTTRPEPIWVTAISIGAEVPKQLEFDRAAEEAAIKAYNDAIALAAEERDHATRDILIQILNDEDRHMDELEELLDQIEQMTLPIFLTTQVE